jgi:hypothetical protein
MYLCEFFLRLFACRFVLELFVAIDVGFWVLPWHEQRKKGKTLLHFFLAVVEQQLKKCCSDKLVLVWFLGLGFAASVD